VSAVDSGVPSLVERDASLAFLSGLLADVRTSSAGRLVALGGEAGVGKTALLRRFCREAKPARILWGSCEPLFTPRPLGPLVDVAELVGGELRQLVYGAARPYEVVMALLGLFRAEPGTILVLDDVHWADEATLDVLVLLATRVAAAPALVVASYRDDELERSAQLRFVLGELVRGPGRLTLEPLSKAAVAELAEPYGVGGEELYRTTAGNPLFVTEVLAAGGERLPETVRDAVLARAGRLSAPGRRLLEAAAVVPGDVELWLLRRLAGELIDHLEECVASGMLSAADTHVFFRHELARLAIEESTSPVRKVDLHRAALAALAENGSEDFAALAHQAEAAGDFEAVLRWAPSAGLQSAHVGAHRDAAAQYERALRFAGGQPPGVRAELLQNRARECYLTSQIDEAIAAQQEAVECYRRLGDRRREADALRAFSRLLFFAGRAAEAEPIVLEAVELLERLPPGHELAMAYANVSQRRMVTEDLAEAVAWGERALELARRLRDGEAEVYALANIGSAEWREEPDRGRRTLERALTLARERGLEEHAARTYNLLVMRPVRERRFELIGDHLDAGLQYCTERGLDTWRLYLLAARARLGLDLGLWDDAGEAAGQVLRDPRSPHLARSWALATVGLARARRGDGEASDPLDQAYALVEPTRELDRVSQVAAARAEAAWLAGEDERVGRLTDAALELALDHREPWAIGELAYWRWQAGIDDRLPVGLMAEPYGLAITGEWQAAARRWGEAGCPYEAALALGEGSDPVAARQAVRELQRLGAGPAVAVITRRLRGRGVRGLPRGSRASTRQNPAGLTARELDVLKLLSDGLRNAQIAKGLVVSEKTVDHHVSSILRKLGARTRGEAAAKAMRLGLTDDT
jgi:DNA-binding CsgD family transcriptional regulator/tetratricopeptide (TPR) repeat protein